MNFNRRKVLKVAAAGGFLVTPLTHVFATNALQGAQGAASSAGGALSAVPSVQKLSDRLSIISSGGSNVTVLSGSSGLVVVDSGGPEGAKTLISKIDEVGFKGAKVKTLFNTHWHLDTTGGNEVLIRDNKDLKVISHHKTLLWMSVPHWAPKTFTYEAARPKTAWPTDTFFDKGEAFDHEGESVEYGYLREAHTDGDAYVHFKNANVIAVGGALAATDADPKLDWFSGGWIGARIDAINLLLKLGDDKTRFITSTGQPVTAEQAKAELATLNTLYTRIDQMVRKGMNTSEMLAAGIMDDTGRTWKDPKTFMYDAQKGVWAHYNTLSAEIV